MSEVSVPITTRQFLRLSDFLRQQGSDRDPVDAIQDAIEYWMENAAWKQDDLLPEVQEQSSTDGYRWKHVFIPSGTKARFVYKGTTYVAEVQRAGFVYEGRSYSPSNLIHHLTGTARNAWRDFELQLPGKSTWTLADRMRRT